MWSESGPRCSREPIVITGFGLVSSLGLDAETVWREVLAGRCGSGLMSAMEAVLPLDRDGGQAPELPPEFEPQLPRETRYLRYAVRQALRMAGAEDSLPYRPERCATMLGTTLHGIRAGGRFLRTDNPEELRHFLAGATAAHATADLGLGGGSATTCSACSSSLGAIALGVTLLQTGAADLVVAGGYDTISEYAWGGFNALRVVAQGPLRPFAKSREGMKLAEGYGVVVLERHDDAAGRGTVPHAVVAGWGESADAYHLTKPHPEGLGAIRAMSDAVARASLTSWDIDMIAAHATGTPDNDASEYIAMSATLGARTAEVPVVGFKSHLGHTLGGAGAVELILSSLALRDQVVPPCANVSREEVEYPSLRLSVGVAEPRPIRATLNTSLGFGGANTCVVLLPPGARARTVNDASLHVVRSIEPHEVCITGLGVVLPGICTLDALAQRVFVKENGAASDMARSADHRVIDDVTLDSLITVRRARRMSPCVKMTVAAATLALADAGLSDQPVALSAMSAILASMHGSPHYCLEYYQQIVREGILAANPMLFAEGVPNAAAAHVSAAFGICGGCQTIIGTRTSGLDALRLAWLRIRNGDCNRVLVAATEETQAVIDRAYTACGLQALKGDFAHAPLPSGFQSSPGSVAILLESAEAARERGAKRYATVMGSASRTASPEGLPAAVAGALVELGRPTNILGSASGTWLDEAEASGIKAAECGGNLGSVYRHVGELYSATPLASLATACLGVRPRGALFPHDQTNTGSFTVLATDWGGIATGIAVEVESGPNARPGSRYDTAQLLA